MVVSGQEDKVVIADHPDTTRAALLGTFGDRAVCHHARRDPP